MRDLLEDERLMPLFLDLLNSRDPLLRLYIYREQNGKWQKPAFYKGKPFPRLPEWLRDVHGGGLFKIMIRRSETMMISGVLRVERPSYWTPQA